MLTKLIDNTVDQTLRELKHLAITKLTDTFRQATQVLVLDADL